MATRGTQFGRTMEYFRTADLDEAVAALGRADRILDERQDAAKPHSGTRRGRKAKARTEAGAGVSEDAPIV